MPNKNKTNVTQHRDYRCPICNEVTHGRMGLKIHLKSHYKEAFHKNLAQLKKNKKTPFKDLTKQQQEIEKKIENLVVKTIFGQSRVDQITKQYLDGMYTLRNLPVNITNYLVLNGFPEKKKELNKHNSSDNDNDTKKHEKKVDEYLTIHKLLSINCNADCKVCLNVLNKGYLAIKDMIFTTNNDIKLKLSNNKDECITAKIVGLYLKTYHEDYAEIANNHFYCNYDGNKYFVKFASLKDDCIILEI